MRKLSPKLYLSAGVITVVIFVMGVLAGLVIEGERVEYLQRQDEVQNVNFESIQLQYTYLSSLKENESCPVLANTLNRYIKKTDEMRTRIERYSDKSNIKRDEFSLLKRKYIISQINYWYLARRTKKLCNEDYVTVLFFYDKKDSVSRNQGFILDYFKKMFGERMLIFALDSKYQEEPMIEMLKKSYEVTDEPTIIVGDQKLEGFQSKDKLKNMFCERYHHKPGECR